MPRTSSWSVVCHTRAEFHRGPWMDAVEILDRVGGGDSFASGFFYDLLSDEGIDQALGYGVAHCALAMTTPGDPSMATRSEVRRLVAGGSAHRSR
jgi:2-dehydro-3-deoxygluconokinase